MTTAGTSEKVAVGSIVFVGGGPRTTGILLRIAANAGDGSGTSLRHIDVVDPYPPGGGRIWRRNQSKLLWMNSMAKDVTIFADESVAMDGPAIPGPNLADWATGIGHDSIIEAGLAEELVGFTERSFASRQLQSLYLGWAFDEAVLRLSVLPCPITVRVHRGTAIELIDVDCHQALRLDNGSVLEADGAVLAQGHLDVANRSSIAAQASINDLVYVPPGFTADVDLSVIPASEPAIVRGFGLAFIDAMVLLTEGRGGQYLRVRGGELVYRPSGNEPELWVGSRRGVPYRPKIGYESALFVQGPHYLDDESLALVGGVGRLDFQTHVRPLLEWNLGYAHYSQLFHAHPERTRATWPEAKTQLRRLLPVQLGGEDNSSLYVRRFFARNVPDPADRFDVAALNFPLSDLRAQSRFELERTIADHTADSLTRSASPRYSMDLAVFHALLHLYFRVHELAQKDRFTLIDRREHIDRSLHGFFSYIASGPPPRRMEELLALHRAGIVRFLGPNVRVKIDNGEFVASSNALVGPESSVRAHTLIDAFLADGSPATVTDPLLQQLLRHGEISLEPGTSEGKFRVDQYSRPLRADGSPTPGRHLLGPTVSGASTGPFNRPGINAMGFRVADALARNLLGMT